VTSPPPKRLLIALAAWASASRYISLPVPTAFIVIVPRSA
jgi:hypothetical protein